MELNAETIGALTGIIGFLGGLLSKKRKQDRAEENRLTRIETKLESVIEDVKEARKDIDGIARAVGTTRARGEMAKETEGESDD